MSSTPVSPPEFYLSLIGLSAIVGAGVSAVFNYFITLRVSRKQNQIRMVEEKLDLYSFIIFQLDKMRFKGEAIKEHKGDSSSEEINAYSATKNELEGVISSITDKIKDRYYLFKQDILKEWVYVNTFFAHPTTKDRLPKLRQMIITEYNGHIIPEYQKLTGRKIDKIL
jgi:hypothetical protein